MSSAQIQSVLDHNLQQQTLLFDQLSKQVNFYHGAPHCMAAKTKVLVRVRNI